MQDMYENYISLGYYCAIASDLERLGLRSTSSPFDWCISDFKGVISAIENSFEGFLDYSNMFQHRENRGYYKNIKYNIEFYHDFDQYIPLEDQLPKVQEKYNRRISRFYSNISRPTLFIRYISDECVNPEGKSCELAFIEENLEKIVSILKKFNENNDIVFVGNSSLESRIVKIYSIDLEPREVVPQNPIVENPELLNIINSYHFDRKRENLLYFQDKYKKNVWYFEEKAIRFLKKKLCKSYIHDKHY